MSLALFLAGLNYFRTKQKTHFFTTTDELLARLKFIGLVQIDEKIDTYYMERQQNNFATKLIRTFVSNDNRNNLKNFLKDTINRSVSLIYSSEDKESLQNSIFLDLLKAQNGIENIQKTYSEDTKFICDIKVIIDNLNDKINHLQNKYNHLSSLETEETSS